jgi:hypothetical protein
MAYKLFSTGEVLTAANVNTLLMRQTVMVFTDSAARTTALSGVLTAGMISYLTSTNSLETYNGSAWVANGVGDVTLTGTQTLTNKTLTLPSIDNFILGYATTVTAAGTTTLTNASNNQQLFTGTTTQTVTMPVASTMTVGTRFLIENNSTGIVTVQSSGANTIVAIPGGMSVKVTAILNSGTTAASWDYEYVGFNAITGTGSNVLATSPTLTTPVISSIVNTGTLTLPTSTDTLVGRATTDTLTNKTLTDPVVTESVNAQTGTTYTPVLADAKQMVTLSNASAITVTIPPNSSVAYAAGSKIDFIQKGAGQVSFAQGSGVTIRSVGATATAPKLRVQYSAATCWYEGSDIWYIVGDIA